MIWEGNKISVYSLTKGENAEEREKSENIFKKLFQVTVRKVWRPFVHINVHLSRLLESELWYRLCDVLYDFFLLAK